MLVMDDWFFSPPLQLIGGIPYRVEFYYHPLSSMTSSGENLEVKFGAAPSAAGMTGGQTLERNEFLVLWLPVRTDDNHHSGHDWSLLCRLARLQPSRSSGHLGR